MGLESLPSSGAVYLDACVIIYSIERDKRYIDKLIPFWERVNDGSIVPHSSSLSLLETLVLPYRSGTPESVAHYRRFLAHGAIKLHAIDLAVMDRAAQLRARHGSLRTPDAIHLATAIGCGCDTILTNDRRLSKIEGVRILTLAD